MKKLIFVMLIIKSLYIFALYQDGEYYVEAKKEKYGWKAFTKVIIKNNQISSVIHNRKNKASNLASENSEYNKKMLAKSGSSAEEYAFLIPENYIKSNYSLKNMDGVAGATTSVLQFKQMMKFLLKKAEKGKTGDFTIRLKN